MKNGFVFQHVYKEIEKGKFIEVPYPTSLDEAKEFVNTYKSQANTDNNIS